MQPPSRRRPGDRISFAILHSTNKRAGSSVNKTEVVYGVLRTRILQGVYAPGQRLILSTLGTELGVSSVPVREALRRLEAEGWVTFKPNIGAEVRPVDASEWLGVMDALALTEGHATALAAPLLGEDDLAEARVRNDEMRAALERMDPLAASDANRAFHTVLYRRCPNDYLRTLVNQANERLDAMRRTVFVFVPTRTRAATDEHEHLLQLIADSADDLEIERYAREHKLHTVAAYLARNEGIDAAPFGQGIDLVSGELQRQALASAG
jgi:DNA-binding GntR family transcriptional regulator